MFFRVQIFIQNEMELKYTKQAAFFEAEIECWNLHLIVAILLFLSYLFCHP